jgi:hypothetical protein
MTPTTLDLGWTLSAPSRTDLWSRFISEQKLASVAEIGVFRGEFAEQILGGCPDITRYYLIDPWRHLDDWDKPANVKDGKFENFYNAAMARTEPYSDKRVVLRGRTTEVLHEIADGELDLAYIDGDHTLRGITIDLLRAWPKVKSGQFVGGDDFSLRLWQHKGDYEPTLVFPYAVYFAEAVGAPIYALPFGQFLIHKVDTGFDFRDLTGAYKDLGLRKAFRQRDKHSAESAPTSQTKPGGLLSRLRGR